MIACKSLSVCLRQSFEPLITLLMNRILSQVPILGIFIRFITKMTENYSCLRLNAEIISQCVHFCDSFLISYRFVDTHFDSRILYSIMLSLTVWWRIRSMARYHQHKCFEHFITLLIDCI